MDEIKHLLVKSLDYHEKGQYEAAEIAVRDALKWIDRNMLSEKDQKAQLLFMTQAELGMELHQYKEMLPLLQQIIHLKPNYREAFAELIKCFWALKMYQEFWECYEFRRKFFDNLVIYERVFGKQKMWDGKASLIGKTVLVYGEQGMGDQIQFVRYLEALKINHHCGKIILNCSGALASLFEQLEFADEIVHKEHISLDNKPEFDYHLPMMSLPYYLRLYTPHHRPVYFKPTKPIELPSGKTNVGFVFAANPRSFNHLYRSIDATWILECMAPNVQLYNLHHDQPCKVRGVINLCDQINDFEDLANHVGAMDKILTIDSALLHLAGSMSKETLALIPRKSDWKWGEGDTTEWYPSVRLAHQRASWDWIAVLQEAKQFLTAT